jgi:hypothetical protein
MRLSFSAQINHGDRETLAHAPQVLIQTSAQGVVFIHATFFPGHIKQVNRHSVKASRYLIENHKNR